MASLTLTATSALGGWKAKYDGLQVDEISDLSIVSIAAPNGGHDALAQKLSATLAMDLPITGESSSKDGMQLLGLQPDQWFLLIQGQLLNPVADIEQKIGDTAHLTDQSDSWVTVCLSGPNVRTALERICPIDLHSETFTIGKATRTSMEHLGVIIHRRGENEFVLLSARSSAESFKHALSVSIDNTQ